MRTHSIQTSRENADWISQCHSKRRCGQDQSKGCQRPSFKCLPASALRGLKTRTLVDVVLVLMLKFIAVQAPSLPPAGGGASEPRCRLRRFALRSYERRNRRPTSPQSPHPRPTFLEKAEQQKDENPAAIFGGIVGILTFLVALPMVIIIDSCFCRGRRKGTQL